LWCWFYPDAARQARQRRSKAAQKALQALRAIEQDDQERRAHRTAAVMADYLRQRLDLPAGEATPSEAADHLRRVGYSSQLAEQTADFFRSCDAVRFSPEPLYTGADLSAIAVELILALEAEPCRSPAS
jgi:hypothetical protein